MTDLFFAAEELIAQTLSWPSDWMSTFGTGQDSVDKLMKLDDETFFSIIKLFAPPGHPAAKLYDRLEHRVLYKKSCMMTLYTPKDEDEFYKSNFQSEAVKSEIDASQYVVVVTRFRFGSEPSATARDFRLFLKEENPKIYIPHEDDLFYQRYASLKKIDQYAQIFVFWRGKHDDPQKIILEDIVCPGFARKNDAVIENY